MTDHASHKISSYKDSDFKNVVFCRVCSREEKDLESPCPGKFVLLSVEKEVDKDMERT